MEGLDRPTMGMTRQLSCHCKAADGPGLLKICHSLVPSVTLDAHLQAQGSTVCRVPSTLPQSQAWALW
jgi:hypothetical protein